ncbi:MAG: hypothetical protein ABSB15_24665 [Bryobacteraceae bacterium]|jgi:hypothetical protein
MARKVYGGDALYIAWKLDTADAASARRARKLLARGEHLKLYRLQSWVVAQGQVKALLAPSASLEEITGIVWSGHVEPLFSRWIPGKRACAEMARQIESMPVALGLAVRPEQWPFSSAAVH